jgi:hypothetical protein
LPRWGCAKLNDRRKLRKDLTPEQRELAERTGSLDYASTRNPFRYRAHDPQGSLPAESSTEMTLVDIIVSAAVCAVILAIAHRVGTGRWI